MLIINTLAFISAVIFTIFVVKLYNLIKHKSLLIFFFGGIIGIVVRSIRLLPNFSGISDIYLNSIISLCASVFFILLAIGAYLLYFEVKNIFTNKTRLRGK